MNICKLVPIDDIHVALLFYDVIGRDIGIHQKDVGKDEGVLAHRFA
jgi:hypothetical protein